MDTNIIYKAIFITLVLKPIYVDINIYIFIFNFGTN